MIIHQDLVEIIYWW